MKNIYSVLIRPLVTEKSMNYQALGKYSFVISSDANKVDVQNAVELLYSTKVTSVNIIPVRKKIRKIGRTKWYTKRRDHKKAVVTLKKGESIDVMKMTGDKKKSKSKKAEKLGKVEKVKKEETSKKEGKSEDKKDSKNVKV